MKTHCEIAADRPRLTDPFTVSYDLRCTGPVGRYFSTQKMFVRYDVDVTDVPEAILLVPIVATIAPIAWLLGARLRVPVIDASFLETLQQVEDSMRRLYPRLDWGGEIRPESVAENTDSGERCALLFSGGVDSLTSYVNHRGENPLLVSVWGADVGLRVPERWDCVVGQNRAFAKARGLEIAFVTTNFRTFFHHYKLRARFFPDFANWYSAAQQGPGLVALCAPLSHTHAVGRVLISAGHTADFRSPWGSHPSVDCNVRWGRTEVLHDGYELTRQKKLELLADYIRAHDPGLKLRVCWGAGTNCSHCTKCNLTIIGLLLEGLNPNDHGLRCDATTFARIRGQLEARETHLSELAVWIWKEIQGKIASRTPIEVEGLDEFLAWLRGACIRGSGSDAPLRTKVKCYLERRPEPLGRWIRRAFGHPFP